MGGLQRHSVLLGPDYALVDGAIVPIGTPSGLPLLPSGQRGWGMHSEGVELGSALVMRTVAEPGVLGVAGRENGEVMIVFVVSGALVVHAPDRRWEAGAGQAWFAPSSLDYTVEWPVRTLMLSLTVPSEVLEGLGIAPPEQIKVLEVPLLLKDAVQRFIETVADSHAPDAGPVSGVVERLLLDMAGALLLSDAGLHSVRRIGLEDIHSRAQRMIGTKYADSLYDTAQLAADLNVSLRQLQRSFAAKGDTPAAALAKMRLEQAQRLLQDPGYRLLDMDEVATYSGFRSARQLREHFRRAGLGAPRANRYQNHPRPRSATEEGAAGVAGISEARRGS